MTGASSARRGKAISVLRPRGGTKERTSPVRLHGHDRIGEMTGFERAHP